MLDTGLDRQPLAGQGAGLMLDSHANVRGAAYYAAGGDVAHGRSGAPVQANQPEETSDQASQMTQDRFLGGGEASGYPPARSSLPADVSTADGAEHTAVMTEEVTHARPAHT